MSEKIESQVVIEDILKTTVVFFHDQYGEAFAAPYGDGSRVFKINSRDFKDWLSSYCWKNYGEVLTSTMTTNIAQALSGRAKYQGSGYSLSVRSAVNDSGLWYDCGKAAIQINKDGWKVVEKPPFIFRRYPHQKEQVVPQKGGDLDGLGTYVNLTKPEDIILFTVFTVTAFIPGFPHPLLIFHGPQGSGKSTPMKVLKELIDPSRIKSLPPPRDTTSFAQLAHHHAFLFFDNLSAMPLWLSDSMARVSTGDGFSKRVLYTDDDDIVYTIQRPIALNGINQVITKPDLLDRSILLGLKRIDPQVRTSEKDFWDAFLSEQPKLLGAIFDVISKAMAIYPTLALDNLPRMADFAHWGYAIAEAAGIGGKQFIKAYQSNIDRQDDEAIENSPVAQSLIEYMRDKDEWKGTAAELLHQLNIVGFHDDLKSSPYWPKDPQWMTKRLNEVEPNLQKRGIFIERYMADMKRITHITKPKAKKADDNSKTVETVELHEPLNLDLDNNV
jgi:hypothetical protein